MSFFPESENSVQFIFYFSSSHMVKISVNLDFNTFFFPNRQIQEKSQIQGVTADTEATAGGLDQVPGKSEIQTDSLVHACCITSAVLTASCAKNVNIYAFPQKNATFK